ncbi:zinc finger protein [Macleaya cordata]|uniref:S-acyltransferase n=1 Tax=Macleaya cordata TaxID=56857 RepID=A0A200QLZ4_MACCD|nr:zinc finger protein [Macleaya cordata]
MASINEQSEANSSDPYTKEMVFFFGGRIICGPDPRGFLVTTVSIILSSWIFCVYVGNDLSSKHSGSIITCSVILTLFVLINLIIVSTIDPGIIPRNMTSTINRIQFVRIKSMRLVINGVKVKLKFCRICNIYRPPRSCHCAICDNCVQKFDHHCPWIGQCIGLRNYRFYLIFIFSALIFFIYIFAFSCRKINRRMSETGLFRTFGNCPETFALASFCFVGMWFLGGLAIFHIYLIMLNQTAYENFRRHHVDYPNPYNKGILSNIKEVCFVGLPPSRVNFRAEATPMCYGGE